MEMIRTRAAAVTGLLGTMMLAGFIAAGSASAEPADPGLTAINDFKGTVTSYGTALIAVVVVAVGLVLAVKYIRKAASKA